MTIKFKAIVLTSVIVLGLIALIFLRPNEEIYGPAKRSDTLSTRPRPNRRTAAQVNDFRAKQFRRAFGRSLDSTASDYEKVNSLENQHFFSDFLSGLRPDTRDSLEQFLKNNLFPLLDKLETRNSTRFAIAETHIIVSLPPLRKNEIEEVISFSNGFADSLLQMDSDLSPMDLSKFLILITGYLQESRIVEGQVESFVDRDDDYVSYSIFEQKNATVSESNDGAILVPPHGQYLSGNNYLYIERASHLLGFEDLETDLK